MENPRSRNLLKSQSRNRAGSGKKTFTDPSSAVLLCNVYAHFSKTLLLPWISEIKVWSVVTVTCSFVLDVWGEELLVISLSSAVGEEDLTEIKRMHQVWRGAGTMMECWKMLF